jgi:hypothetical protein
MKKLYTMNKKIIFSFFIVLFSLSVFAQTDSVPKPVDKGKKPVKDAWAGTILVDAQTPLLPYKGSLELIIQHRFSSMVNNIHDLFGLYGASNIRLAMQYAICDKFMVGFSTEKDKKYQEFYGKFKITDQNRDNSMPLSISAFANVCISAQPKSYFGLDSTYKFADRLSYFAQVIFARKFTNWLSFEIAPSWTHVNKVEGVKVSDTNRTTNNIHSQYKKLYQSDVLGATAAARLRFHNNMSFLLEYDQGFYLKVAQRQQVFPMPNAALAFEINSNTHCFQVFASTYRGLIPQQNFLMNQRDVRYLKDFMIGFNITVRLR